MYFLSIVLNLVISFSRLHPSREERVRHLYVFFEDLNKNKITGMFNSNSGEPDLAVTHIAWCIKCKSDINLENIISRNIGTQ